jgi:predicted dehydrogenase
VTRSRQYNRRQFLQDSTLAAAGTLALPSIIPSSALGLNGAVAPSERLVLGAIGTGGMGRGNLGDLMNNKDVQAVAVCDCDKNHAKAGGDDVNKKYGNNGCAVYHDFRELCGRKDIDIVLVATPDHWHALASIEAVKNGKDVYCEKPLTNSVAEGKALVEAVKKHNRILQTGTQERSGDNARYACELVRNGRIGKLQTLRINLPDDDSHHKQVRSRIQSLPEKPVPEHLDFDMWMGHTPKVAYNPDRVHFFWRFILTYGGGEMTDRGAHVIDLGQLGAGTDDTVPVEYEAKGVRGQGDYNVFWDYEFTNTYANGLKLVGTTAGPRGVKFEGTEGWIFIHVHGGALEASDKAILKSKIGDSEIQLGRAPGYDPNKNNHNLHGRHRRSFLDSVKSRKQPTAPVEVGHHTGAICHLNNIAMITGRRITFDPAKCQIEGDDEANKLLTPVMRAPWTLS